MHASLLLRDVDHLPPAHPAAGAVSPTMFAEDLQHQVAGQSVQPPGPGEVLPPQHSVLDLQVPAEMDRRHCPNGGRQDLEDAAVRTAEGGASRPGKTLQEVQGQGEPQELQH